MLMPWTKKDSDWSPVVITFSGEISIRMALNLVASSASASFTRSTSPSRCSCSCALMEPSLAACVTDLRLSLTADSSSPTAGPIISMHWMWVSAKSSLEMHTCRAKTMSIMRRIIARCRPRSSRLVPEEPRSKVSHQEPSRSCCMASMWPRSACARASSCAIRTEPSWRQKYSESSLMRVVRPPTESIAALWQASLARTGKGRSVTSTAQETPIVVVTATVVV
mmetsp:Transcript_23962/g.74275  ORF Transcript_23962/g.74275 Transcript_23962/m.74275 type:complete len:223 (+) Transcript_23962:1533-2201(+)